MAIGIKLFEHNVRTLIADEARDDDNYIANICPEFISSIMWEVGMS